MGLKHLVSVNYRESSSAEASVTAAFISCLHEENDIEVDPTYVMAPPYLVSRISNVMVNGTHRNLIF